MVRNLRGSQSVKATQTEEVGEEVADEEGEVGEQGEQGRARKSFLTSKLARLLSFSQ